MTPRNLAILLLTCSACFVCAVKANQSRYVGVLNEALRIVAHEYVQPVNEKELFENAMFGMLDGLDENTNFIPESEYEDFEEEITNEFGGIGIRVNYDEQAKRLVIASPMPDTPAIEAGLQPLDEIISIDGQLVKELGEEKSRKALRGPPGEKVKLSILSAGAAKPHDVEVVRDVIMKQTVLGDLLNENGEWDYRLADRPEIAYLRIESFGDGTAEKVEEVLRFDGQRPKGLILDLRDNPGGLLDSATHICDLFLNEGQIVSTRGRGGALIETHEAISGNEIDRRIAVVVLVNENSASASEIVAACLQDHRRAKVVGVRSYGKGTVQNVIPLQAGRSALRLTIASYWRPSGKNIQRPKGDAPKTEGAWGVSPDEGWDVKMTEEEFLKTAKFRADRDIAEYQRFSSKSSDKNAPRENLLDSDPQLRKAVECIDSMTKPPLESRR